MSEFRSIEVFINGVWKPLVLNSGKGAAQMNNPLFRKSTLPGYFTFPIDIPYEENAKCLGFPAVFSQENFSREFIAREKLFGGTWCCGRIQILKANKTRLKIVFQDNQGELKDLIKGVSIRDICNEVHSIPCGEDLFCRTYNLSQYIAAIIPNNAFFEWTIGGNVFTVDFNLGQNPPATAAGLLQLLQFQIGGFPNIFVQAIEEISPTEANITICFPPPDLPITFASNAFGVQWSFVSVTIETIDRNICLTNYITDWMNQPGELSHYFFPIYMPNAYDGENPNWNGWINYFDPVSGTWLPNGPSSTTTYAYAPQVSLKWLLKCIEDYTGFKFKGDIIEDECFCKLTIKNNRLLDEYDSFNGVEDVNVFQSTYTLSDAIPDISIEDFFKTLQVFGELKFDKFDKCITISNRNEAVNKKATIDWSDLVCGDGDICYPAKNGYKVIYSNLGDETKTFDPVFNDYVEGNAGKTTTIPFAPLGDYNGENTNLNNTEWLTPCTYGIATTDLFDVGENDCGFRLQFYHGMHEDSNGNLYPLASSCAFNYNGDRLCNWDLKLNGDDGLVETFMKDWLEAIDKNPTITVNIDLQAKEMTEFDYCEPIWMEINCIRWCFLIERLDLRYDECDFTDDSKIKALAI